MQKEDVREGVVVAGTLLFLSSIAGLLSTDNSQMNFVKNGEHTTMYVFLILGCLFLITAFTLWRLLLVIDTMKLTAAFYGVIGVLAFFEDLGFQHTDTAAFNSDSFSMAYSMMGISACVFVICFLASKYVVSKP